MINADADVLKVDPAKIALGESYTATPAAPEPQGPACAASLAAFRSSLFFRNLFTALVAVLALMTLVVLGYCVYRVATSDWDASNTFAALGGAVTGVGAVLLQRERSKAIKVLDESLSNVGKYCGEPVHNELT
jgi:hypothetical protein